MEIGTVIEIMDLILKTIEHSEEKIKSVPNQDTKNFYLGYKQALLDLNCYLQDSIEPQLNAWENIEEGY